MYNHRMVKNYTQVFTKVLAAVLALVAALAIIGCSGAGSSQGASSASGTASAVTISKSTVSKTSAASASSETDGNITVVEDGEYSDKDHVALYIHKFGHLPSNYISKTKARKAGWVSSEGNLWDVLPGMSIGGSEFYNDEEVLPEKNGRRWTECDIGYAGGFRGAERIVFSNDGLVFYTSDHYETFEQLY